MLEEGKGLGVHDSFVCLTLCVALTICVYVLEWNKTRCRNFQLGTKSTNLRAETLADPLDWEVKEKSGWRISCVRCYNNFKRLLVDSFANRE